jgi:hypothetical protein
MPNPGPEVKRDCQCPQANHQHGTRQAYLVDRCRCFECRAASASRRKGQRRRKAYGRQQPKAISGVGTRRRIQALVRQGWSLRAISTAAGWYPDRVYPLLTARDGANVQPDTARRVAAVYDRLWDKRPPRRTMGERMIYTRTVRWAEAEGWLPPMAWDDIDDPDELPDYHEQPNRPITNSERLAEYGHLWASGLSEQQIADKLGLTMDGLRKSLQRALSAA